MHLNFKKIKYEWKILLMRVLIIFKDLKILIIREIVKLIIISI